MPAPAISTAKQSDQGGLADLLGIAPEVTSANAIYGMCIEGVVFLWYVYRGWGLIYHIWNDMSRGCGLFYDMCIEGVVSDTIYGMTCMWWVWFGLTCCMYVSLPSFNCFLNGTVVNFEIIYNHEWKLMS